MKQTEIFLLMTKRKKTLVYNLFWGKKKISKYDISFFSDYIYFTKSENNNIIGFKPIKKNVS